MPGLKLNHLLVSALLISAGGTAQSADDTLTLVSGEILRGDLLEIDDGVMTFRTRHGSRTYLPFDQIQTMKTGEARVVALKGGDTVTGRLAKSDGQLTVDDLGALEMIDIENVSSVELVTSSGNAASFETGVLFRAANRSHVDLYARIQLGGKGDQFAWSWEALFALDRAGDFPDYVLSEFQLRGDPGASRETFFLLGLERDRDAEMDVRLHAAAGYDYKLLFDDPHRDIRAGVGVSVRYESYDARHRSTRDTDLDLLFRVIYNSQLRDRLIFHNELRGIPGLTDIGEFRASYDSRLAWTLLDGLELNLQLRIDYDDDPPFSEIDRWRAAVGAGLRVRFGPN